MSHFGMDKQAQRDRRARSVSPTSKHSKDGILPFKFHTLSNAASLSSLKTTNHHSVKAETAEGSHLSNLKSMPVDNTFKQKDVEEVKAIREMLIRTRQELTQMERTLLDTRELTEDAKSGLMMLELKHSNAFKDLERLNEEIRRKQEKVADLDTELQVKLEDLQAMMSIGVSKEECLDVKSLKDEIWSLRNKLENMESLQTERDELVRQMNAAKEDLIRHEKHDQIRSVETQEELEVLMSKLEELQSAWSNNQDQINRLQQTLKKMEREKIEIVKVKTEEYENLKASMNQEVSDTQQKMRKQIKDLESESSELRLKVGQLTADSATKEMLIKSLRDKLEEAQCALAKEKQERTKLSNDYKTALNNLKREMTSTVTKIKDSMFLEKQKALEVMKQELAEEHRELTVCHENKLQQLMDDHRYLLAEKDEEIKKIQEALRCQEQHLKEDIEMQVHEAILNERSLMEQETDWLLSKEQQENSHKLSEVMAQWEKDKQTHKELQAEIGNLKKELDNQKKLQREANKEKLLAVSKAKEQMKQQNSAEIERIKFNINQEHEQEFDQLREKLRLKEDEASQFCAERQAAMDREKQMLQTLEQTEKLVIKEINKECQKISHILGISFHNHNLSSFRTESLDCPPVGSGCSIPAVTSALVNLQQCNEHLLNHLEELTNDLESMKSTVEEILKEKDDAVVNCQLEMEKLKNLECEKLKEKLLQEHVEEMSRVIQECASTNSQLRTNSECLQRYGDAALLEALQAKDDELRNFELSMSQWKDVLEEKFNTKLQIMMAKEKEKYQAIQHHTTREQTRINDLQKREIERLENEVQKLSAKKTSNKNHRASSPVSSISQVSDSLSASLPKPAAPENLKASQQYLNARIQQLQADNAALRKQRLLTSRHLGSTPNLTSSNLCLTVSPPDQTRLDNTEKLIWQAEKLLPMEKGVMKVKELTKVSQQKILNNKMDEMAKLQNTLINQNRELQELERAYNDLHKHYSSRSTSPSRNLNVTF